jgi:hypothetical protein
MVILFRGKDVLAVHDDDLVERLRPASCVPVRASHVEPDPEGGWQVTLSQAGVLGEHKGLVIARRVPRHDEALRIEREYLEREVLK